jgi:hypothetical protein
VSFFPEASQFTLELSRELIDQTFVADENVPQPVQDPPFEFGCADPAVHIAGALLTTCRTVVTVPSTDGHTAATAATFEETREQPFFGLPLVAPSRRKPLLKRVDSIPKGVFNKTKSRNLLRYPLVLGIGASNAFSCFRIFQEFLTVTGMAL